MQCWKSTQAWRIVMPFVPEPSCATKFFREALQFGPVRAFQIQSAHLGRCTVRGVAQSGSAPVLGTGGREFESRRPDQFTKKNQMISMDIWL